MLLQVKNNIEEISNVCSVIKNFCDENNICETKCYDILVIIDELATNIISYAYEDSEEHFFSVFIEKDTDFSVHIRLIDDGISFNPLQKGQPDISTSLEEREIGGLGIFLVKQLSSSISYKRTNNQNLLDITVNIKEKGE